MRIYLDNCCLNRIFDDQSQSRIRVESESVKQILDLCERGVHRLVTSEVQRHENAMTPDPRRRKRLMLLIPLDCEFGEIDKDIVSRAKNVESMGLKAFDALHFACAEMNADVLLTVDDGFLKRAQEIADSRIRVLNPLIWLAEELK